MSDETPPYQHRSPITLDVLGERMSNIREELGRVRRDMKDFMDEQRQKEEGHIKAIEHCNSHDRYGEDIENIRMKEIPAVHARIDALQGSSGAIAASRASPPTDAEPSNKTPRTWPELIAHPGTAFAVAALICLVALIVVASTKTGRDASSFVPNVSGAVSGAQP